LHQPIPRRVRLKELPALVGTHLGSSGPILVTQDHIDQFADVTLDRQWLHVERRYKPARGSHFRHLSAPGSLLS